MKFTKLPILLFLLSCYSSLGWGQNEMAQQQVPQGFTDFDKIYSHQLDSIYDDYNFWNGHWKVTWKSWKERDQYVSNGDALHRVFSALDGKVLIELAYSDSIVASSKTAGFSIRYFDSGLKQWVMLQSWPGRNAPNISSLKGTSHHGRIQLYQFGKTSNAYKYAPPGTPYANRYTFSDATTNSFRWDSSVSTDSMRTWHTGSIAESNRIPDFTSLKEKTGNYWYTYGDGYNCDDSVLADLRPFLGDWRGETTYFQEGVKRSGKTTRVLMPFLSNCAALGYQITEHSDKLYKEIIFATYLPKLSKWVFYTINNIKGESQSLYVTDSLNKQEALFTKKEFFTIPSKHPTESFAWSLDGNHMVIKAFDKKGNLVFEKKMKKLQE